MQLNLLLFVVLLLSNINKPLLHLIRKMAELKLLFANIGGIFKSTIFIKIATCFKPGFPEQSTSSLNKMFLPRHQLLNNSQLLSQGLCKLITGFIHYTKKCKLNEGTILQCAKKVGSDSLGLVDFAIGLVNFALNLHDGK